MLNRLSISQKLTAMLMMMSSAVLSLASVAFVTWDFYRFREEMAVDLATQESLRLAQRLEADGAVVDVVQVGQRVHHRFAHAAVGDRILAAAVLGRNRPPHHGAATPLHDEELRADHRGVVAVQEGARRQRIGAV